VEGGGAGRTAVAGALAHGLSTGLPTGHRSHRPEWAGRKATRQATLLLGHRDACAPLAEQTGVALAAGHERDLDRARPLPAKVAQRCVLVVLEIHDVSLSSC